MKVNLYNLNCDCTRWQDLLTQVDQNRCEEIKSGEKKYLAVCKKGDNDAEVCLMILKKKEMGYNHKKLNCHEIIDISSQFLKKYINIDLKKTINENLEIQKNILSILEKETAQIFKYTKKIIERRNELINKKIQYLNLSFIVNLILIISIIGLPIFLYLKWILKNLNFQKNSIQIKVAELEDSQLNIARKINDLNHDLNQLKVESPEKLPSISGEEIKQVVKIEESRIKKSPRIEKDSQKLELDESEKKIESKNQTIQAEENKQVVVIEESRIKKSPSIEKDSQKVELDEWRKKIENRDHKIDSTFWNSIDKLVDETNLTDKILFYKSLDVLSRINSITPLAIALGTELNSDQKNKLVCALVKASENLEMSPIEEQKLYRKDIYPQYIPGNEFDYGILIDENKEVHIIREIVINGEERSLHRVTSVHTLMPYVVGVSLDEGTVKDIQKECAYLELLKNEPGVVPPFETVLRYTGDKKKHAIYLQKWFPYNGTKLHSEKTLIQLKVLLGVFKGLCALHKHKVAHCNLKPTNILIDENLNGYLSDFKACTKLGEMQETYTPLFAAPEVVNDMDYDIDHTVSHLFEDSYSMGIILLLFIDHSLFGKDRTPINQLSTKKLSLLFEETKKKISQNKALTNDEKHIQFAELELAEKLLKQPLKKFFIDQVGTSCEEALKELTALYSKYEVSHGKNSYL